MSDKLGMFLQSCFTFFFGFAFAFYWGWLLTLILCGSMPVMMMIGTLMTMTLEGGIMQQMKAYS